MNSHVAALSTTLEGQLDVNKVEEVEKQGATEYFYGTTADETVNSVNAFNTHGDSGYAEYRDDMDDFPDVWKSDNDQLADYEIKGSENSKIQWTKAPDSPKTILKPKTRKIPAFKQDATMVDAPLGPDCEESIITAPPVRAPSPGTVIKGKQCPPELLSCLINPRQSQQAHCKRFL